MHRFCFLRRTYTKQIGREKLQNLKRLNFYIFTFVAINLESSAAALSNHSDETRIEISLL